MKHLFTLSLVFFSLSHLAQAQRTEVMDVLSARYCGDQIQDQQSATTKESNRQQIPGLLNPGDLSLSGVLLVSQSAKIPVSYHVKPKLVLQRNPRNNIP